MDAKNHSLFHLILQLRKLEHREFGELVQGDMGDKYTHLKSIWERAFS